MMCLDYVFLQSSLQRAHGSVGAPGVMDALHDRATR